MSTAFLNTFLSLCSCSLFSPNISACHAGLSPSALSCPCICFSKFHLLFFFSPLSSILSSSRNWLPFITKQDKKPPKKTNKAINNPVPDKVLVAIPCLFGLRSFSQCRPCLLTPKSLWAQGLFPVGYLHTAQHRKVLQYQHHFLTPQSQCQNTTLIFNAAHPRGTYTFFFFF